MTDAAQWSGAMGDVWAAEWRRTDRSFADLSRHLDPAIFTDAPVVGTALDIGCGAGATSIALATARADLSVIGIDVSAELIATARRRADGLGNARFIQADINAAAADLPRADLLCSRHGVMFFDDPIATFATLRAIARPGASLVFSCFRARALNPWASDLIGELTGAMPRDAADYAPGPFAFADLDATAAILAQAGWRDAAPEAIDVRYLAGAGDDPVADATGFFRRIGPVAAALRDAPAEIHAALLDKLAAALQKRCENGEVVFPAAAWIWRARAPGATA